MVSDRDAEWEALRGRFGPGWDPAYDAWKARGDAAVEAEELAESNARSRVNHETLLPVADPDEEC